MAESACHQTAWPEHEPVHPEIQKRGHLNSKTLFKSMLHLSLQICEAFAVSMCTNKAYNTFVRTTVCVQKCSCIARPQNSRLSKQTCICTSLLEFTDCWEFLGLIKLSVILYNFPNLDIAIQQWFLQNIAYHLLCWYHTRQGHDNRKLALFSC